MPPYLHAGLVTARLLSPQVPCACHQRNQRKLRACSTSYSTPPSSMEHLEPFAAPAGTLELCWPSLRRQRAITPPCVAHAACRRARSARRATPTMGSGTRPRHWTETAEAIATRATVFRLNMGKHHSSSSRGAHGRRWRFSDRSLCTEHMR